ncbi:hypothetical protein ACVWYH_009962 [Bradyrhizobium sp. GM24.11]
MIGNLQRVGAGRLEDRDCDRLLVVEQRAQAVFGRAKLDARDVAQSHDFAARAGLDHDVAELFFVRQTSLGIDGELQVDALDVRGGADYAGGSLDVLRLDRLDDVACGQPVLGRLLRIDPDPHRIVAGTIELDVTDAVDPRQAVFDVEHRVVAQIRHVVAVVRRQEMHDHGQVGRRLLGDDAELAHHSRQARLGLLHAVLHQLCRLVRIGAEAECHRQRHRAVGGRLARHVQHAFDAVDLLLDRRRHRFRNHFGIGAGIGRAHQHRGRHDIGIFRDRHREQRDQAGEKDQDRKDACKNRTIDEEF